MDMRRPEAMSGELRLSALHGYEEAGSNVRSLSLTPCVSMKPAQSNPLETMQLSQSDALRVHAARSVSRPACP
ncbi:hypothetical protein NDU88_013132 [Pleurodeles waltl]|uniref:Uncharacterized protein n=1 Tax=Pleurodeles waltl TaxID=8319 RepID=A0AAV7R3U5_PLEWA|nr:hypothetical protein NDU88_013132 [Pleurodeles waltl]